LKKLFYLLPIPAYYAARYITRTFIKKTVNKSMKSIVTDQYDQNLWGFFSSVDRASSHKSVENSLRTEYGYLVERPFGSPKQFPSLDRLMFSYAQLRTLPTPEDVPIDLSVVIGKNAKKPLHLRTPIMVSGMAYGEALTEAIKVSLAQGAAMGGTAYNTGEGGMLASARKVTDQLILQYNRGHWAKDPATLRQANAIELQFGQGAIGGTFHVMPPSDVTKELRKQFEVKKGQPILAHARIPGINSTEDFIQTVKALRKITDGVPIGAKIGAGDEIEEDISLCVEAGVDYIAVDGAEAASKGSPPILLDDFGLPTLIALVRAVNHLQKLNAKDKVDLIISGKLLTPADFLKALALGANAIYIGSAALFATIHTHILKSLPFGPPSQVAWYGGKYSKCFDTQQGADNLYHFLISCKEEMEIAIRAMGKTSIHQLSKNDLVAIDPYVSEITSVRSAHLPRN